MTLPDYVRLEAAAEGLSASVATISAGRNYLFTTAIANQTNLDKWADIQLHVVPGAAPTVDKVIEVYLLYSEDETNYENGAGNGTSATNDIDPKCMPVGLFHAIANSTAQRAMIHGVPLAPYPFKVLLKSELDQTCSATVTVNTRADAVTDA